MAAARERIEALTGLRFLAAALVFVTHAVDADPSRGAFPAVTLHSMTAVGFFFCLSGFVIAYTYAADLIEQPARAGRYLRYRVARIVPMYLVALAATVPLGLYAGHRLRSLALQATLLQSWSHDASDNFQWNGVGWSLSTEAFFYVAFPVLAILVLRRLRTPRATVVAWALVWSVSAGLLLWRTSANGTLEYWVYVFPPYRFLEFALGALVGWYFVRRDAKVLPERAGAAAALALVALIVSVPGPQSVVSPYPLLFVPLFSLVVYWLASEPSAVARRLGAPRMRLLGEASYSFFLLHLAVLFGIARIADGAGVSGGALIALKLTAGFALTTALSVVTLRRVEQPARRWLRGGALRTTSL